jgi:hypothetical protein
LLPDTEICQSSDEQSSAFSLEDLGTLSLVSKRAELLLLLTFLLRGFYSLQTMFSNVASRRLDDRDNNKGRREKCN